MAEFSGRTQETNQTTIVQTQIYRITTGNSNQPCNNIPNNNNNTNSSSLKQFSAPVSDLTSALATAPLTQALLTQLAATSQGSNQALASLSATVANIAGNNGPNQKEIIIIAEIGNLIITN